MPGHLLQLASTSPSETAGHIQVALTTFKVRWFQHTWMTGSRATYHLGRCVRLTLRCWPSLWRRPNWLAVYSLLRLPLSGTLYLLTSVYAIAFLLFKRRLKTHLFSSFYSTCAATSACVSSDSMALYKCFNIIISSLLVLLVVLLL